MSSSGLEKLQLELKYGNKVKDIVAEAFVELMLERVNEKVRDYAKSNNLDDGASVQLGALARSYLFDGGYKLTGDDS